MNDCVGCDLWKDGLCDGMDDEAFCPELFVGQEDNDFSRDHEEVLDYED